VVIQRSELQSLVTVGLTNRVCVLPKKQMERHSAMTSARWQAITKIFEAALEKPQADRNIFVQDACAGDLELECEITRLLAADEAAGSFLENSALRTVAPKSALQPRLSFLAYGSVISGRFEILRFIGQGGMGRVYEALDLELKEKIALKAIRPDIALDPRMLSRFKREVQLTRRITHPNVCRTFDIERDYSTSEDGTKSDLTFLTMELLEGETLSDLLRRQGPMTSAEAKPLVLQMIEALSAAHRVGIVHRDFKPSNVVLVPSNRGLRVVVTDFGLARAILPDDQNPAGVAATSLTGSQGLMGTLVYMAPEQFERGEASVASDIYALGLVMYEMVTCRRPFADAIPFAEAAKRIKEPAPSPKMLVPELDSRWDAAICRCLQLRPEDRFDNVQHVAASIANFSQNISTQRMFSLKGLRRSPEIAARVGPSRSGSWRKGTVAIAILALVVSLSVIFFRHYQLRSDAKLAGGATVLLTEIKNSTGDKRFDDTTELLRHQLSQSPYFNLMANSRIRDVLTQMTKPPTSQLDPPIAREVALRGGAPRVLFGAVSRVGDSYVLDIDIEQPDNDPGRSRAQWEKHWTWNMSSGSSDAEIPSGFLVAVRDGSDWIRDQIGEAANDIAKVDAPPQDVTTDNWEALSEFAQAEQFDASGQTESSIVALKNAVAADPHFALAYTRLADELDSLGRYDEGYRAYQIALDQAQQRRLTRREKDRMVGIYASDTEDFKTAESTFRDFEVYYPSDYLGWFYRARPLMMMGRTEEAIAALKQSATLFPSGMAAQANIARYNLILGKFEETSKWIQHLRNAGYDEDADLVEGESDFLQGRYKEAEARFTRLIEAKDPKDPEKPKNPLYLSYGYSLRARLCAEMGRYEGALEDLRDGADADLKTGDTSHRADKLLDQAYIRFKRGEYDAGLQSARSSLNLDRSLQRSLITGTFLGQAAYETAGPMKAKFAAELRAIEMHLPPGHFKPFSDIVRAHLRGEALLAEGKWKAALEEFKKADQLEAPTKDKEYLARGLLAAAQHTTDPVAVSNLSEQALTAYAVNVWNPGLIWQWSIDSAPGLFSDETLSYVREALRSGKVDSRTKAMLDAYRKVRANADVGIHDVAEADALASSRVFTKQK
jgi:eukaryotic-like serine/threonine-protein kinase